MNNIDENIEILFNEIKRTNLACGFNQQTKILKSRDNILKRLFELEEDLIDHEKTSFEFQELYIKTKSELETYKKIAEKLAWELGETDNKSEEYCDLKTDCTEKYCSQCIIDWARKEVEKDE